MSSDARLASAGSTVPAPAERRRGTILLLLAAALLGAVQLLLLAPWMGEDEPWQVEYASHIAGGYRPWGGLPMRGPPAAAVDDRELMPLSQLQVRRRFHAIPAERIAAVQAQILASMAAWHFFARVDWAGVESQRADFDQVAPTFTAADEPPLYYGLVGGAIAVLGAESAEGRMWVGRGLSWIFYVLTVLASLALARCAFEDERLAVCAAAFVAFLPMSARQAAVVNNDVLAKLLAAIVLLVSARWTCGRARRWEPPLALVLCGVGLLVKPTVAGVALALLAVPFLRSRGLASRGRTLAILLGFCAVVAIAMSVLLKQHNTVFPRSWVGLVSRLEAGFSAEGGARLARSLVGSFGWESRFMPDAIGAGLVLLGVCLAANLVVRLARRTAPGSRQVLFLCMVAVAAQLALLGARGLPRGRYFMPALPALAVVLAAGWLACWPSHQRTRGASMFLLGLVALEAVYLWGGLTVHEHLLWGS